MDKNNRIKTGLQLLANFDAEMIVTDVSTGKKLTPELLYIEYFQDLSVVDIYDFYVDKIKEKHEIMDRVDAEKKEIARLIVQQPEFDKDGNPVVYLTLDEAREKLSEMLNEEKDEDDEIYVKEITDEGLIFVKDNVKHIGVREIFSKHVTMNDWIGGKDEENND